MAVRITRKKIIVSIVVILLVGGGAAAAYAFATGYFVPPKKPADSGATTGKYESFKKTQVTVDDLITSGDEKSIQEASQIIEAEVIAADESGNDAYIVEANLAKASLLISTGKAQEAFDSILLALDEKYSSNETYKYDIYGQISWAYAELDNPVKADEYYNKIPSQGWD